MAHDSDRDTDRSAPQTLRLTRRALLQGALAAGGIGAAAASPSFLAQQERQTGATRSRATNKTLDLARVLNRVKYEELPPQTMEYAKVIIASTLASAAFGNDLGSSKILRDLSKEAGGKAESTVWFDGTKLPVNAAARLNALLSDSAASDDSDMRNTVHAGTTLASAGLAMAERTGTSGRDLLGAMVIGYEAAGRINTVIRSAGGGPSGVHASQLVGFGGAVACSKLLKLTDDQMAQAMGITAITMGGISVGTNSWAREYMGANASFCGVNAALAASRGFTVNDDMLGAPGGYFATYGAGAKAVTDTLTKDTKEWDITKYLAIKLVPGGHGSHATAEAAVNAAKKGNVSIDDIAKIYIARPGTNQAVDTAPPKDMIEAIHSVEYFVASAMIDKDYTWIHASDEKIHRPAVARMMALIEPDPAPAQYKYSSDAYRNYGGTVTIVTKSGARFTSTVEAPRASGPRGIQWSDIDAKYHALMPLSKLPASKIDESLKMIKGFDQVKNVSELMTLIKVG